MFTQNFEKQLNLLNWIPRSSRGTTSLEQCWIPSYCSSCGTKIRFSEEVKP